MMFKHRQDTSSHQHLAATIEMLAALTGQSMLAVRDAIGAAAGMVDLDRLRWALASGHRIELSDFDTLMIEPGVTAMRSPLVSGVSPETVAALAE
jgi:hypothetical protein